jgi:hypothetical protein
MALENKTSLKMLTSFRVYGVVMHLSPEAQENN